jgi:hypothetical protein
MRYQTNELGRLGITILDDSHALGFWIAILMLVCLAVGYTTQEETSLSLPSVRFCAVTKVNLRKCLHNSPRKTRLGHFKLSSRAIGEIRYLMSLVHQLHLLQKKNRCH